MTAFATRPFQMTAAVFPRHVVSVLDVPIDALAASEAVARIADWASRGESRVVCICNAHSIITARQDATFMQVLRQADMATPDGAPVAWMLRRLGIAGQSRVTGPELMLDYCAHAASMNESIFLYGNTDKTLDALKANLLLRWPNLRIGGAIAPPFRQLSAAEDAAIVEQINASGAATVWVSLGCPKQEIWMAAHLGHVGAVMIGVGAAFDFHAGTVSRAPTWMRNNGLEWLHRLIREPRRLGRRYLITNSAFVLGAIRQLTR